MKVIKRVFIRLSAVAAPLALAMAFLTASSTCFFLSYQPDEPACIRDMISTHTR